MTPQKTQQIDVLDLVNQEINQTENMINETKKEFNNKLINILDEGLEEREEKNSNKIIDSILFFIKYIFTSSIVFGVLMVMTNYQAYIEIAQNYVSPDKLQNSSNAMLTSINSTNILKAQASDITEEQKLQNEQNSIDDKIDEQNSLHSMDKLIQDEDEDLDLNIEMVPYENRIIIPKIGKNIPLVDVENRRVENVKELDQVFMEELANGVVRYPGSARPGEEGNAFIFGHSSNFPWAKGDYNDVFALLDNVVFGDEIIVYYNQKKYTYVITEKNIIKPGDTDVLKRNNGTKEISIMTCWPVGTSLNRMIVTGELKEVE